MAPSIPLKEAMMIATEPDAAKAPVNSGEGRYVRANGADIYYVEAGRGEPLLLLHGGAVSTSPVWAGVPVAYVSHMETFAAHFRVIAPDTRGCGRTVNPGGGPVLFTQLADDVVALIEALGLDRPAICGFSEGGLTATIVGIRNPGAVRAIVNDAGYDMFDPQAPTFAMMRQMFGGGPEANRPDLGAFERAFAAFDPTGAMLGLMKADHEAAQGPGYLEKYLAQAFDRVTQPPGYTVADLRRITAPTLILTGDRDEFCTVEEGVAAYRTLQNGELAILPGVGHDITPQKVQISIDFLLRHTASQPGAASA
jgi:pimeloyl-ACP methyl ester carboxylesterase